MKVSAVTTLGEINFERGQQCIVLIASWLEELATKPAHVKRATLRFSVGEDLTGAEVTLDASGEYQQCPHFLAIAEGEPVVTETEDEDMYASEEESTSTIWDEVFARICGLLNHKAFRSALEAYRRKRGPILLRAELVQTDIQDGRSAAIPL